MITNKQGLPTPFVQMCQRDYVYRDKRFSVTSLLKGVREAILERRHAEEITQDVSEMIWMIFGTAAHSILERAKEGEYEFKENSIEQEIKNGYVLSGRFDLYNAQTKTVTDYKTCSVWKVKFGDYEDWRKQLLAYGWILRKIGFEVEKGEIIAILRDHKKSEAKFNADYPQYPVKKISFKFREKDFEGIEKWIYKRFAEIEKAEALSDAELPLCSAEERYKTDDKYAVKKRGVKTARRVLNTLEDANKWMAENGENGLYIEYREGENKKCLEYCAVCDFCEYGRKERMKKDAGKEHV